MEMEEVAIVRQRGQITIPEPIRSKTSWLKENSVVRILRKRGSEIVIKPLTEGNSDIPDWGKIWKAINLARSFKGKRGNLSSFIAQDRFSH